MEEVKKISKDNLLSNLTLLLKSTSLIDLYNEVLDTGKCDKDKLKDIGSAIYYYMLVKSIELPKLPQLGSILSRFDAPINKVGELQKAQLLYFIYFMNSIDLNLESSEKESNLYI